MTLLFATRFLREGAIGAEFYCSSAFIGDCRRIGFAIDFGPIPAETVERMSSDDVIPGFRWPVAAVQLIAAPAAAVWDAISMPGNLEFCHPFCASNPVHVWPGPDARDEIRYLSGWVYERQFRRWIEGSGYDLEIGRRGGGKSLVSWRIYPVDDRSCTLRIAVYPDVLQRLPVVIRWIPHQLRLRPMLEQYLQSVVRGFEWYVTRGEPVPRDNFGKHPWFSANESAAD